MKWKNSLSSSSLASINHPLHSNLMDPSVLLYDVMDVISDPPYDILASTCLRNVMEQNESNRAIIYAAFMVKLILLNMIIFVN